MNRKETKIKENEDAMNFPFANLLPGDPAAIEQVYSAVSC